MNIEELKAEKDKYYYEWKHLEANMINKIEELYDNLEKMPEFMKMLDDSIDEIIDEKI